MLKNKKEHNKLRIFINILLNNYNYFPEKISIIRLVFINKVPIKLDEINNIRGIAINSILIKLIE
jgi:hypothetical protein